MQRLDYLEQATSSSSSTTITSSLSPVFHHPDILHSINNVSTDSISFTETDLAIPWNNTSSHNRSIHPLSTATSTIMEINTLPRVQGIPLLLAATRTVSSYPSSPTNKNDWSTISTLLPHNKTRDNNKGNSDSMSSSTMTTTTTTTIFTSSDNSSR